MTESQTARRLDASREDLEQLSPVFAEAIRNTDRTIELHRRLDDPKTPLADRIRMYLELVASKRWQYLEGRSQVPPTSRLALFVQQDPSGLPRGKAGEAMDWDTITLCAILAAVSPEPRPGEKPGECRRRRLARAESFVAKAGDSDWTLGDLIEHLLAEPLASYRCSFAKTFFG
jgi:hypothetical protein